MHIRSLREPEIRQFVEELWLPFHRELVTVSETHELADDVDLVATETDYRREQLAADDQRAWVAVDSEPSAPVDTEFAGFLTAEAAESPSVFTRADRVVVNDLFVHEPHRGTGLADELLARAAGWARDLGHGAIELSVHVDNDRARAFYDRHGLEARRERLVADVGEVAAAAADSKVDANVDADDANVHASTNADADRDDV